MKVLLTGGAGYIGSHTCVELINSGYEPVIADNLSNSSIKVLDRIEKITGKKPIFYEIDVADFDSLDKLFFEQDIDAVIHFAGYKAVGESYMFPVKYYRNNINTTLTLLDVMKKHGVNKIVFSSSATVYGIPKTTPCLDETMPTCCANPYGWTKLFVEQILRDTATAEKEFSVVLLRYFNPIGAHESGLIGDNPNGIPNNLMPYITQVAVKKLPYLRVFGNDYNTKDGTGVRDYIHVVDLARGHLKALEYADKHNGTEVFNLGTGNGCSVLDVVNAFSKANDMEIPYQICDRRPGDIDEYFANPKKANDILNWKAEFDLFDMCRDSWNWQKNNKNGYDD